MTPKVTSSIAAVILGISQQYVEKLSRDGILPCELVQAGEDRHMKVFDREVLENVKKQRELAKSERDKAA